MRNVLFFLLIIFTSSLCTEASEIHDAARDNDKARVIALIENDPSLVHARNDRNATPLHFACDKGHVEIAAVLLKAGAEINVRDVDGDTPIYWAVYSGYDEMVRLLIDHGASVTDKNNNHLAPLHYGAMGGREDTVRLLLEQGATIDVKDHEGYTPLHVAALRNKSDMVKMLLDLGADLENEDERERTPLLLVARETGNTSLAKLLIDLGADVNKRDRYGDASLDLAAWRGFEELVDLLLERGASVDVGDDKKKELLGHACNRGLEKLFDCLVKQGVDPCCSTPHGGNLLHSAAFSGSSKIVNALISEGVAMDAPDRYGWTALHCAAKRGRGQVVDLLIEKGVDPNAVTLAGRTAWSVASRWGHEAVAERLARLGVSKDEMRIPKLTGPYLGQEPPGDTPEVFALDIVSSRDGEHGCISFTTDGKEAYWSSFNIVDDSGYSRGATLASRWGTEGWTSPEYAFFCEGIGNGDDVPFCTPDGKRIYFISRRPDQPGGRLTRENVWFVEREGDGWSKPRKAAESINSLDVHWQLSVSLKGTLYIGCGPLGICASSLENGKHSKPIPVANSAGDDFSGGSPFIAPDESYLIFSSMRQGGHGGDDLFITFRDDKGEWGCPKNMGPSINSASHDLCPMVTLDGKFLFFLSHRNGRSNVYWVDAGVIEGLRRTG